MFDGFALERIDVGEAELRVRHGGSGPALVLLHGHPRTHATRHRVAPLLAERHTVVPADLRGYGQSSASGPPGPTTCAGGRSNAAAITSPRRSPRRWRASSSGFWRAERGSVRPGGYLAAVRRPRLGDRT